MIIKGIEASELHGLLALYNHLHELDHPLPEQEYVEATWREIQASPWCKCFGVYIVGTLVSSCVLVGVRMAAELLQGYAVDGAKE